MVEITAVYSYSTNNDSACIVMLWGQCCEDENVMETVWGQRFEKDLWETCEKDLWQSRCEKTLWKRRCKKIQKKSPSISNDRYKW